MTLKKKTASIKQKSKNTQTDLPLCTCFFILWTLSFDSAARNAGGRAFSSQHPAAAADALILTPLLPSPYPPTLLFLFDIPNTLMIFTFYLIFYCPYLFKHLNSERRKIFSSKRGEGSTYATDIMD